MKQYNQLILMVYIAYHNSDFAEQSYVGGYFNTTSAIDEIQFKFSGGNIDAGTFKLYGIA